MGNRRLLLVRYGDYTLSVEFPQNPDGSLNEKGQKQAACIADHLQTLKIDAIHTSSLMRAHETAALIAARHANTPLHVNDDLQECIPIVPQGLEKHFEGIPAEFIESGPAQADQAFTTYFTPLAEDAPDRVEVIVSHGNLIGYLVARVMDAPAESWLRADIGNCCISEVRIKHNGIIKLIRHNDGGHLPAELGSEV